MTALLALMVALVTACVAGAAAPGDDPVDALKALLGEPRLAANKAKLEEAAAKIVSIGDLTRALLLPEWSYATGTDRDISDEIQEKLTQRLEKAIRGVLAHGDDLQRIAVVNLIREAFSNFRKQGAAVADRLRDRLRALAPDFAALTKDRSPAVRVAVGNALGTIEGDPAKTVPLLRQLLADKDTEVRRAAADGLANMVLLTAQASRSPTTGVRLSPDIDAPAARLEERAQLVTEQSAVRTLMNAVPAAASGLADKDVVVRRVCAITIRRGSQALADLIKAPAEPQGTGVKSIVGPAFSTEQQRAWARGVLRGLQGGIRMFREEAPMLTRAASDSDPVVRLEIERAYEQLAVLEQRLRRVETTAGTPAIMDAPPSKDKGGTGSGDGASRPDAASDSVPVVLHDLRPHLPAAPIPLPAAFPAPVKAVQVAFQGKGTAPPPAKADGEPYLDAALKRALAALTRGLSDRMVRVRIASLEGLEVLGARAAPAIPEIVKTAEDPNLFVRWAACRTLGALAPHQSGTVVPVLAGRLRNEEDLSVQLAAATALQAYGKEATAAVPALLGDLQVDDDDVRLAIYKALERIGVSNPEALALMARGLKDTSVLVRQEAAQALGKLGPAARSTLPALRAAMFDPDDDVRRAASAAVLAIDVPK
jgi:HEAT repeat protein